MILVFDLESNGLREDCTKIWCIVAKELNKDNWFIFTPENLLDFFGTFDESTCLIGHNIIDYDLPVLSNLLKYKYKGKVIDTLIMSRLLNPDRKGGHSLDIWGKRVGVEKPTHEDWSQFSKKMLHRCKEDVTINELTYNKLLKEMRDG